MGENVTGRTYDASPNAQHVNGMTPFDVRLLDTLE